MIRDSARRLLSENFSLDLGSENSARHLSLLWRYKINSNHHAHDDFGIFETTVTKTKVDASDYADFDVSEERSKTERHRRRLLSLITRMADDALSFGSESVNVSRLAAATAIRFLEALPVNRKLPKVSPDGEGDLLFVWDDTRESCYITVEHDRLHLLLNPGKEKVSHVDNVQFIGQHIPLSVLPHIPVK
jgi:hypothetical protein